MYSVELGIDTLSYYCRLTPKQKSSIIERLKVLPDFRTEHQDYWEKTYVYHGDCFAVQGVKLIVSQIKGSRWGLLAVVHPTLVLGTSDRSVLYQPEKKSEYKNIVKIVDKLLVAVNVPCSIDEMKLYRCDVTANLAFDKVALAGEYMRIMKKSSVLPHYIGRSGSGKANTRQKTAKRRISIPASSIANPLRFLSMIRRHSWK